VKRFFFTRTSKLVGGRSVPDNSQQIWLRSQGEDQGAFLAPLFVVALLPNLSDFKGRRRYQRLLMVYLSGVAAMHVAWIVLKL